MYYFHFNLPCEVTQGLKKARLIWQFPFKQAKKHSVWKICQGWFNFRQWASEALSNPYNSDFVAKKIPEIWEKNEDKKARKRKWKNKYLS